MNRSVISIRGPGIAIGRSARRYGEATRRATSWARRPRATICASAIRRGDATSWRAVITQYARSPSLACGEGGGAQLAEMGVAAPPACRSQRRTWVSLFALDQFGVPAREETGVSRRAAARREEAARAVPGRMC